MARPKKARYVDGVQLEENLYADNKGRKGHYRYLRPNGTGKFFTAETVHQANAAARKANMERDGFIPNQEKQSELSPIGIHVENFITWRQQQSPDLLKTRSWENRRYALRKFAREFTQAPIKITREHIEFWWDNLSFNQQKQRHAEFRRLFNYLMSKGICRQFDYNPFTTSDDRPRLYLRSQPSRSRLRLDLQSFWSIYAEAGRLGYEGLQIAMGISLLTFMRQGDILSLKFEHIDNDQQYLKKIINKSAAQKGHVNAKRLQWDIAQYKPLKKLIARAKELSLKNLRCPYLISHMPIKRCRSKAKNHVAQLTKERLAEQFREAREATGLWKKLSENQKPPSFHEIRSLADMLAASNKFDTKLIQQAMAHSDEALTLMYQAHHDLPYDDVEVQFTEGMIGGEF